ncbi:MAG: DEAD/DEAH box helicase [Bacteroidetes bacterium]|nr:DEAD/DEAH box helicase [Bacteroidota bacterium]
MDFSETGLKKWKASWNYKLPQLLSQFLLLNSPLRVIQVSCGSLNNTSIPSTFAALAYPSLNKRELIENNFDPSEIQKIHPFLLKERFNNKGQAQTGTGKTLAVSITTVVQ